MVSGRQEVLVPCKRCGVKTIELDFADRKKQLCTRCVSDVPSQMTLFPKHMTPRMEPKRKLEIEPLWVWCETCKRIYAWMFIRVLRIQDETERLKAIAVIYLAHRRINPETMPYYAGMCQPHFPKGSERYFHEQWAVWGKGTNSLQGV